MKGAKDRRLLGEKEPKSILKIRVLVLETKIDYTLSDQLNSNINLIE